jgi:hypothetical protein
LAHVVDPFSALLLAFCYIFIDGSSSAYTIDPAVSLNTNTTISIEILELHVTVMVNDYYCGVWLGLVVVLGWVDGGLTHDPAFGLD